ncbi:MAG: HrpE/YscL family type III secretion apparatus protein [Desulfobacteraceae bacterium]|nr:HrpE/YscL family type III secretion apparatus protein [Desulfobacteraceae bacterium]
MEAIYLKQKTIPDFRPGKKIIKPAEYNQLLDAEQIIAEAHKKAEQIIADAKLKYEQEAKRGYQDGLDKASEQMSGKVAQTVASTASYYGQMENKMVKLAMLMLNTILGEMDDHELVRKMVSKSLETVRNEPQVNIKVHPCHADTVNERLKQLNNDFPNVNLIEVSPEPRMTVDGCILESEAGYVDGSLNVQLESIEKAFKDALKQNRQQTHEAKHESIR